MTPKEQITRIKECANLADASYAMLHYIEENDEPDGFWDKFLVFWGDPPAKWIYADGIKRGYEIQESNLSDKARNNNRSIGQPTAYALAIEARFSQDRLIKLEKDTKPKEINNEIQNFILRDEDHPSLENQKIKVSTQKEKMAEEKTSYFLSKRTKDFVSRYELIAHQKNTDNGFSATLFKDTKDNQLILACRGTESLLSGDSFADLNLAEGIIPLQCYDLAKFYEEKIETLLKENEKILVVGHSLGGYLAQSFCYMCPERIQELYTFNSPGLLQDEYPTSKLVRCLNEHTGDYTGQEVEQCRLHIKYAHIKRYLDNKTLKNLVPRIRHSEKFYKLPEGLQQDQIHHIEITSQFDFKNHQKHLDQTFYIDNPTQHLGIDIPGHHYPIYFHLEEIASHYISTALKILYFYEYLLEFPSNEKTFLKENLKDTLNALNTYHKNLNLYFGSFLRNNGYHHLRARGFNRPALSKELQALYASIIQKTEKTPIGALLGLYLHFLKKKSCEESKVIDTLSKGDLIEILYFLKERSYFIRSIDHAMLQKCKEELQSSQDEFSIKITLNTFAIFIFVNQDDQPILTKEDFSKIFGYNTPEMIVASNPWNQEYLIFQIKTTQACYFGGSIQVRSID